LGNEHFLSGLFIVGRTHRNPIGYIVTPDDNATGMNAGITHVSFEHLGILHRIGQ
jgi:hypothetical protein